MNKIIQGDSLEVLKTLDSQSVDCIITSPPYYGLRDYGTAKWDGGDAECGHKPFVNRDRIFINSKLNINKNKDKVQSNITNAHLQSYKTTCAKCGAKRIDNQIGLEATLEEYIAKMVNVFSECKRVLKNDGTFWLNIGDSYSGSGGNHKPYHKNDSGFQGEIGARCGGVGAKTTLSAKNILGVPFKLAFALQADGWILRQDIIWQKVNPMPESVKDRCTKSHEYIFLLAKQSKYYYDSNAIKEKNKWVENRPSGMERNAVKYRAKVKTKYIDEREYGGGGTSFVGHKGYLKSDGTLISPDGMKNKRSVWTTNTNIYADAHFATFPLKLIEPMMLTTRPDAVILDPFMGAGTVAIGALMNGRKYLGIELNPEYVKLAEKRIEDYYKEKGELFDN